MINFESKLKMMKTKTFTSIISKISSFVLVLMLAINYGYAQIELEKRSDLIKPETNISDDIIWHVKAFRPEAQLFNVKAVDKKGKLYDVKAFQSSDSPSNVLNIKAIVNDNRIPIKIVVPKNSDKYFPLVAITEKGKLLTIIAVNDEGKYLEVKAVSKSGNVLHISALTKEGNGFNVVAISPFGEVNSVVGIKMLDTVEETVINGVSIFAHVKAIKQN
jgi:hypothetical protein